ncbi:hypothetical protein VNO78_31279 [Psophocarpus tetragonolobus]|uniref:BZIP domain-containing protein n=1 Tax=Psophocarpus tetragonolobus TaxID=3891 RepID=A0AAN9RZ03_PSOTE
MREPKIRGQLIEEKPNLIKPIPRRAQVSPIGIYSSFQPWQKPSKPLHKLATIPENDNQLTEENATNESGVSLCATNDQNTSYEAQANIDHEMEKKFKRIISNRHSARRSRLKNLAHMIELENRAKSYEKGINILHNQIAGQQNEQRLLQIEFHTLKLNMAAHEKQRILQEVEIEKNRAEVDRLREVQRKLALEAQSRRMPNLTSLQIQL